MKPFNYANILFQKFGNSVGIINVETVVLKLPKTPLLHYPLGGVIQVKHIYLKKTPIGCNNPCL